MKRCKYCGWKTFNNRRLKKHMKECEHGQSEARPSKGQEVKKELVKAQIDEKPVKAEVETVEDEGIDYDEMNIHEIRKLAREEGMTGIYGKNKAELIEALREGA